MADPDSALAWFTAHRGGQVLGRITAHIHGASNRLHGLRRGYFGYFDLADDADVAAALLRAAEAWHRARGMTELAGNFNLTAMQQIGVMTGGHDLPTYTDQVWSPPWAERHLRAAGFAPVFPMSTFELDLTQTPVPDGPRAPEGPDFTFVPITRRTIAARMEDARTVLNLSFARNPMFVPLTREEFAFQARDLKWVVDPRLSAVMFWRGRPAAATIVIPDVNPLLGRLGSRLGWRAPVEWLRHRLTNRRAVLIFAGVIPELQGRGINPMLMRRVMAAAGAAGYQRLGTTWIADVNGPSLAQVAKAGAQPLHRLHLFSKALA